jgi:hypothetical protein
MNNNTGGKKGGGLFGGLWTGTAVFAAMKARNYTGFLKSYLMYGIILMIGLAVAVYIAQALGLVRIERFSVGDIQCQPGETPTDDCNGERGCRKASGNCYKLLTTAY